jgi:hypothetical protein
MEIQVLAARITELEQAFGQLAETVPGLSVAVVGHVSDDTSLVHPVAGFEVRLQREEDGAGASLYVSVNYGELRTWPPQELSSGGARRERFNVHLTDEFCWGDSVFDTAAELAQDLLAYMQFNLDAAAEV